MSRIIFPVVVDLITAATPSSGFTLGYDLDGVLKQKDSSGVITPIGSLTNQPLYSVLNAGNNSGTFSIILGTSSSLKSSNGGGQLDLDYNGNSDRVLLTTNSGSASNESQVYLTPNSAELGLYTLSGTTSIIGGWSSSITEPYSIIELSPSQGKGRISIETLNNQNFIRLSDSDSNITISSTGGSMSFNVSNNEIKIVNNSATSSSGSGAKSSVFISTQDSFAGSSVTNSPVIGGIGLTAYSSNTVYLGNSVNINNKYTLPSVDGSNGQVLKTNGSGVVTWGNDSSTQGLSDVLAYNNDSVSYDIIMGTSTAIKSSNSFNSILLDDGSNLSLTTDNGTFVYTNLRLNQSSATLNTSTFSLNISYSQITVGDSKGLRYSTDYSATFVTHSLVDKKYVDSVTSPITYANTAFVDRNYGSDSTGTINRFDKSYKTVAAAVLGLTTSAVTNGVVHLRAGTYTETVNLYNNYVYYCEPGVNFTDGGFRDLVAVTASVLGYASFIGTTSTLYPLNIRWGSTVNFEFDEINNRPFAIRIINSNVDVKGNKIYCRADSGHAISVRQVATSRINISKYIRSAYKTISVDTNFSGTLNIECPEIRSTSPGMSGYLQDSTSAVFTEGTTTGTINIKGNIINDTPINIYTLYSDSNSRQDGGLAILGGNVSVEGNIFAGETKGLMILGTVNSGQVKFKGDIQSYRESVVLNSNITSTYLSEGTLKSWGSGSLPYTVNVVGTSSTLYLRDSIVWNTKNNSSIVYILGTNSTVGIYDTLGYSTGTTGNFIYTTQSINVGFHSVRSNKDNSILVTDLFGPSGFIYDTGLFIPNLL